MQPSTSAGDAASSSLDAEIGKSIRYLSRDDVRQVMPPIGEQIDLVERCYRSMAAGRVELPPKPGIHPRPNTFIHAMPAYLKDEDVATLKWVAGYPQNKDRGLPYITGLLIVNDPETGLPIAVMDAAEITAVRTAAASGACIRAWGPEGWTRAAILGCGVQGSYHAQVIRHLQPEARIAAYDVDPERVARMPGGVEPASGAREAVEGAEVVVTTGPILDQPQPPVAPDWLGERFLLLPVDLDSYVQAGSVARSQLFLTDDIEQFEYFQSHGHFAGWPRPRATDGEALEAGLTGERVTCCNIGVGALDAAFAHAVLRRAAESGIGVELPL